MTKLAKGGKRGKYANRYRAGSSVVVLAPDTVHGRRQKGHTMKKVDLPLSELSLAQKLDLMETLWTELARDEKALKSPEWHETVLRDREAAFAAGKIEASDWEEAKERIRREVS